MPYAEDSAGRKLITLAFVGVWAAITLGLAFESVATIQPPYYGLFTALVFLLVGRLWDIEVDRLLPTNTGFEDTSDEDE